MKPAVCHPFSYFGFGVNVPKELNTIRPERHIWMQEFQLTSKHIFSSQPMID